MQIARLQEDQVCGREQTALDRLGCREKHGDDWSLLALRSPRVQISQVLSVEASWLCFYLRFLAYLKFDCCLH